MISGSLPDNITKNIEHSTLNIQQIIDYVNGASLFVCFLGGDNIALSCSFIIQPINHYREDLLSLSSATSPANHPQTWRSRFISGSKKKFSQLRPQTRFAPTELQSKICTNLNQPLPRAHLICYSHIHLGCWFAQMVPYLDLQRGVKTAGQCWPKYRSKV